MVLGSMASVQEVSISGCVFLSFLFGLLTKIVLFDMKAISHRRLLTLETWLVQFEMGRLREKHGLILPFTCS